MKQVAHLSDLLNLAVAVHHMIVNLSYLSINDSGLIFFTFKTWIKLCTSHLMELLISAHISKSQNYAVINHTGSWIAWGWSGRMGMTRWWPGYRADYLAWQIIQFFTFWTALIVVSSILYNFLLVHFYFCNLYQNNREISDSESLWISAIQWYHYFRAYIICELHSICNTWFKHGRPSSTVNSSHFQNCGYVADKLYQTRSLWYVSHPVKAVKKE